MQCSFIHRFWVFAFPVSHNMLRFSPDCAGFCVSCLPPFNFCVVTHLSGIRNLEVWLPPSVSSVCACVCARAQRLRLTLPPPSTQLHTSRLNTVWFREQQGGRKLRVKTFKRTALSANKMERRVSYEFKGLLQSAPLISPHSCWTWYFVCC